MYALYGISIQGGGYIWLAVEWIVEYNGMHAIFKSERKLILILSVGMSIKI